MFSQLVEDISQSNTTPITFTSSNHHAVTFSDVRPGSIQGSVLGPVFLIL